MASFCLLSVSFCCGLLIPPHWMWQWTTLIQLSCIYTFSVIHDCWPVCFTEWPLSDRGWNDMLMQRALYANLAALGRPALVCDHLVILCLRSVYEVPTSGGWSLFASLSESKRMRRVEANWQKPLKDFWNCPFFFGLQKSSLKMTLSPKPRESVRGYRLPGCEKIDFLFLLAVVYRAHWKRKGPLAK